MNDIHLEPGVILTPGSIKIASVVKVYENERVQLWTIDGHSKYYEVVLVGRSIGHDRYDVELGMNFRTLKFDQNLTEQCTVISFPVESDWDLWLIQSSARYSINLVFYRHQPIHDIGT